MWCALAAPQRLGATATGRGWRVIFPLARAQARAQARALEFATASGTVKRWNGERGFGFIEQDTGDDIFVHRSAIVADGFLALAPGESVEFEAVEDQDGRVKAEQVTGPDGGDLLGPWPPGEVPQVGVVARWLDGKGFGFIQPNDGGDDVFCHQSAIFASGFRALVVGDTVEYSIIEENGKVKAGMVSALGGQPIESIRTEDDDGEYGGGGYGGGGGGQYRMMPNATPPRHLRPDTTTTTTVFSRSFSAKTCQAMRKRFKLTANGKLKHKGCGNNHKADTKNRARHNRIKEGGYLTDTYTKTLRQFLGKSTKA